MKAQVTAVVSSQRPAQPVYRAQQIVERDHHRNGVVRVVLKRRDIPELVKWNVVAWQDAQALIRHRVHERRHMAFNTIGDASSGVFASLSARSAVR